MSDYLYEHYKGKYRVLANYDIETNDFPRDEQGNIDSDFNDFYIPGKKNVEIRHAGRNRLGCYVFSTGVGKNILKDIYELETNKKAPTNINTLINTMIEQDIIDEVTLYDGELLFIFKSIHIDDWAHIFKLKTSGAKISPLSNKNLPKSKYEINKKDENRYMNLINNLSKEEKMQVARKVTGTIMDKLSKKDKAEMKRLGMKPKQYIHYKGMWDKFIQEIAKEINNEK